MGLKLIVFVLAVVFVIGLVSASWFFSSNSLAFPSGESMAPTFSSCTLLVVDRSYEAADLIPGDIAVVDISDQQAEFDQITHRVVENSVANELFSTRGDNDAHYDFPSSIDGYYSYDKFVGIVSNYVYLPEWYCKIVN